MDFFKFTLLVIWIFVMMRCASAKIGCAINDKRLLKCYSKFRRDVDLVRAGGNDRLVKTCCTLNEYHTCAKSISAKVCTSSVFADQLKAAMVRRIADRFPAVKKCTKAVSVKAVDCKTSGKKVNEWTSGAPGYAAGSQKVLSGMELHFADGFVEQVEAQPEIDSDIPATEEEMEAKLALLVWIIIGCLILITIAGLALAYYFKQTRNSPQVITESIPMGPV